MTSLSTSRRQAAIVAAIIWAIDAPMILAPSIAANALNAATVIQAAVIVVGGWALCLGLFEALRRLPDAPRTRRYAGIALCVVIAAVILGAADQLGILMLERSGLIPLLPADQRFLRAISNTIFVAWMFTLFAAIVLLLESNRRVADREKDLAKAETRAAQAQSAATAARLAALRYQLNPHFLFNTLNAVSSAVINRRNDEAEAMLARLAEFLRATLSTDPSAEVRLEEELGTVEAYLEIELERFRDRLAIEVDCPEPLRAARVPSFLLQPVVENAVKHGVSRSKARVRLNIAVETDAEDLVIRVEDDASPLKASLPSQSSGIGLSAIRERLEVLYGDRARLQAEAIDPGFRVTIRLPLRLAKTDKEAA